jgi:FtsP/CotA-like multicopper oxidase with cupredoxin domain
MGCNARKTNKQTTTKAVIRTFELACYLKSAVRYYNYCVLQIGTQSTNTPYAQINVQFGSRYRLRIVGALCTVCPIQLTIDGHQMLVIATDGNPVAPTRVDAIVIYSGNFLTVNRTQYTGNSRTERIRLLVVSSLILTS